MNTDEVPSAPPRARKVGSVFASSSMPGNPPESVLDYSQNDTVTYWMSMHGKTTGEYLVFDLTEPCVVPIVSIMTMDNDVAARDLTVSVGPSATGPWKTLTKIYGCRTNAWQHFPVEVNASTKPYQWVRLLVDRNCGNFPEQPSEVGQLLGIQWHMTLCWTPFTSGGAVLTDLNHGLVTQMTNLSEEHSIIQAVITQALLLWQRQDQCSGDTTALDGKARGELPTRTMRTEATCIRTGEHWRSGALLKVEEDFGGKTAAWCQSYISGEPAGVCNEIRFWHHSEAGSEFQVALDGSP
ncbi:hypothetical protein Pelo_17731 [Pelomyxa schiedti]|nr:hypothetical protein Pelo_17731 [Pelomyxa schiedti]